MNDNPFFSIIIPCYNRAELIGHAIHSILNQTFQDFEVLIIDDGSTDDTKDKIVKFTDDRIRYYYKKNEERNIARNFGVERANGKFTCFLDSDDEYLPAHLETLHKAILSNDSFSVYHTRYHVFHPETGRIEPGPPVYDASQYKEVALTENIFTLDAVAIKTDVARKNKFLNSSTAIVGEDHFWFINLFASENGFFIDEITVKVVQHDNRSSKKIDPFRFEEGTNEMIRKCKENPFIKSYYNKRINKYYSRRLLLVSTFYIQSKYKKRSFRFLLASLKYNIRAVFTKPFWAVIKNLVVG